MGGGGTSRKVKRVYLGVDGSSREIKKAYIGVNGVAKQFWPSIIYTWKKYRINYGARETFAGSARILPDEDYKFDYDINLMWTKGIGGGPNIQYRIYAATDEDSVPYQKFRVYDVSKTNLKVTNIRKSSFSSFKELEDFEFPETTSHYYYIGTDSLLIGDYAPYAINAAVEDINFFWMGFISDLSDIELLDMRTGDDVDQSRRTGLFIYGEYFYRYELTQNSRTLIGTVTSDDPNAYPEDGMHTDGYWYTRQ